MARPNFARLDSRLETHGRIDAETESKNSLMIELPLFQGRSFFFLIPSTDGMGPTHTVEGNLLFSKSTALNINLVLKIPS